MKILVCSGADHNYFPLLREMVFSLRRFSQAADFSFAVIDGGLNTEQKEWLAVQQIQFTAPDWPSDTARKKAEGRDHLKACICRPWLNTIFPGYDLYLWLDADTWVQNWDAVALYINGAKSGKLAASGQVDRGYPRSTRVKFFGPLPVKLCGFYYSNAKRAFGYSTAQKLFPFHVLQAGVFALLGDAPHWAHWQKLALEAVERGKVFTAEQLTMGVMCHLDGYPFEMLPAWCNWLCEFVPPFDSEMAQFVEPYLPRHPIGIMHISGFDAMRRNRSVLTALNALDGSVFDGTLRTPFYDGETDRPLAN